MAIIETITDDYYFWNWIKHSDSYSNNFTLNGAKALQEYLDNLSNETGENVEFDPIAWCCGYGEYKNIDDFNDQYFGKEYKRGSEYTLETLKDNATVIEFDGGIIVEAF